MKIVSKWNHIIELYKIFKLVRKRRWSWTRNSQCKYLNIRIDMRDLSFLLEDRHGNEITIEQLNEQSS